uniref:Putative ovule protein n=1 Tax=Solanum chacoense TaxID=4108 RepID=A0A0V0GT79_SOLCH
MVQGLDSSFSGMSSLPRLRSLTPPAPPMLDKYGAANQNIHEEGEISLLQPAYQTDKENSTPEALLVSGQSPNENADGTPPRSQPRCSSIWSRRGKPSNVTDSNW